MGIPPEKIGRRKKKRNGSRPRQEKKGFGQQLLAALNPSYTGIHGEIALLDREIEALKEESDSAFDLNTPEGDAEGVRLRNKRYALICEREALLDKQKKRVRAEELINLRQEGYILPSS